LQELVEIKQTQLNQHENKDFENDENNSSYQDIF
jgi:hypothetical protein